MNGITKFKDMIRILLVCICNKFRFEIFWKTVVSNYQQLDDSITLLIWSFFGFGSSIAPTPNTSVAGTINYYVTQTIDGCESIRKLIQVKDF